jgi:hypothetical protein
MTISLIFHVLNSKAGIKMIPISGTVKITQLLLLGAQQHGLIHRVWIPDVTGRGERERNLGAAGLYK